MEDVTLLEHWRMLGPPGKLLVLVTLVSIALAIVKVARLGVAKHGEWQTLGVWFQNTATFLAMLSFMYVCVIGILVSRGRLHFMNETASGWVNLSNELTFHFRTLLFASMVFTFLHLIGSSMRWLARRQQG